MRVYTVQGNYGPPHGWEDLTSEDTKPEAMDRMREYAANEPGVPFRLLAEHIENHKVRRTKRTDYKG